MAKNKNFKINRYNGTEIVKAIHLKIGDVFEREGSLHMKVNFCHESQTKVNTIIICNLNTGNVWRVRDNEAYKIARNCEINYRVDKEC